VTTSKALIVAFACIALPTVAMAAKDKSTPVAAKTNPANWFPESAYPAEAKRKGEQGRVVVKLAIDSTGTPTGCTVVSSSGSAGLDEATCRLAVTNGKFRPARDAQGRATMGEISLPGVRWILSRPRLKLAGPWRVAGIMQIDRTGKIVSCRDEISGPAPAGLSICMESKTAPANFGLSVRSGAAAELVEVTMETSLDIDGDQPLAMDYEKEGRELLRLAERHYDVDVTGDLKNCRVIAQSGTEADICSNAPTPFQPIERPQGLTMNSALSRAPIK
jgi:TonB family protein